MPFAAPDLLSCPVTALTLPYPSCIHAPRQLPRLQLKAASLPNKRKNLARQKMEDIEATNLGVEVSVATSAHGDEEAVYAP